MTSRFIIRSAISIVLVSAGAFMGACATTSSSGVGGSGGSGNTTGNPNCTPANSCQCGNDACAACKCAAQAQNTDPNACNALCSVNTGGTGGVGTGGVGGGTGTCTQANGCQCQACYDTCVCQGGDAQSCLSSCGAGTGGTGGMGTGGTGGSGFGGTSGSGGSGFGGSGGSGFGGSGGSGFGGSGGTGGSGFGGSGGTGGGSTCTNSLSGATQCTDVTTNNATCDNCIQTKCCNEMSACLQENDCAGLLVCIGTNCAGITDQTQFDNCVNTNCGQCAAGANTLNTFGTCQSNNCATECGG